MKGIESVAHVGEELFASRKSNVRVESIIIRLVRVWDYKVWPIFDHEPIRKLVCERIPIIKKSACFYMKPPYWGRDAPSSIRQDACWLA